MELPKEFNLPSIGTIVIRQYQLADYSQVQANLKSVDMFDEAWDSEESLKRMIAEQPYSILVATMDGRVIGSTYLLVAGFWAQLYRLNVINDFQKQGVAGALLDVIEEILKDRGIPEVSLFYREDDSELGDFYTKRGWKKSSKLHQAMWKEL